MKLIDDFLRLQSQDYVSYLTILLMNPASRDLVIPLFCLATELKCIPLVSSELTGLMRLRWWQDQIEAHQPGNPSDFLQKLPPAISGDHLKTFIQGYEHLLETPSLGSHQEVLNLSLKTDISLLRLATTALDSSRLTTKDEHILNQVGLVLTSSYLYLQRAKLLKKGFELQLTNQQLMEIIKENHPKAFTPKTRWLAPFSGYGTALYRAFKKEQKPSLAKLQMHMLWAYARAKFTYD